MSNSLREANLHETSDFIGEYYTEQSPIEGEHGNTCAKIESWINIEGAEIPVYSTHHPAPNLGALVNNW